MLLIYNADKHTGDIIKRPSQGDGIAHSTELNERLQQIIERVEA
jgi:hypothetical protein